MKRGYDFAYACWMRHQIHPEWNRLWIGSFIIFGNIQKFYHLANGDIVPRVCPYCQCRVDEPEKYLEDHEECFP